MKRAYVLTNERLEHQVSWGGAFAEGLRRHGWRVGAGDKPDGSELLVMWGVRRDRLIAEQVRRGCEVCVLERGYVGDRFAWTSVSFGGKLNGRATFRGEQSDPRRWRARFGGMIKPWRTRRDGVGLICGQVPGDASIEGVDMGAFYMQAADAAMRMGLRAVFRPHPMAIRRGVPGGIASVESSALPLDRDLSRAAVCFTWNSNAGVDAVLAGVPVVAIDRGSMAWDVAGHTFQFPPTPDRWGWAYALAWKQWTREEFVNGDCWEHVGRGICGQGNSTS